MDPDQHHRELLTNFDRNVRARADELGWSLSDVANTAGIPRVTLHAILSQRRSTKYHAS